MLLRLSAASILASGFLSTVAVTSSHAADPTGDWQVEGGFANIRVAECSGAMWGVVAWEKTPGGRDKNNADPAKQSRPTLGMVTLFDMKKKPSADEWEGQVYDAQTTGRMWTAKLFPKGPNQLRIEGCAMGFICSGQDWTRVAAPIPSSPSNSPKGSAKSATAAGAPVAPPKSAPPKTAATPKAGASAQTPDVGDICLLPEITGAIAARSR